jgi:hypothetical protein
MLERREISRNRSNRRLSKEGRLLFAGGVEEMIPSLPALDPSSTPCFRFEIDQEMGKDAGDDDVICWVSTAS